MNKHAATAIRLLAVGALLAGLAACEQQDLDAEEKGPAAGAGEQIDLAVTRAGEQLNKVAEEAGENLEEFGRSLQAEARQARRERAAQGGAPTSGE